MFDKLKKKAAFSIGDLSGIAVTLMIVAIILGIGLTIVNEFRDTQAGDISGYEANNTGSWSIAYNATTGGLSGLATMADYQDIIALVAVAAVIIGIVMFFFGRKMN